MIASIFAMSRNRVIGKDNQLPWHLPADLKYFKSLTVGHPIIMGRKTFESIGRPLPQRTSIVITRQLDYAPAGCLVVHTLADALAAGRKIHEDVFIIGGAEILRLALPYLDAMHLTLIHQTFEGDTFYPELDPAEWHEVARQDFEPDEKNHYAYSFIELARNR